MAESRAKIYTARVWFQGGGRNCPGGGNSVKQGQEREKEGARVLFGT